MVEEGADGHRPLIRCPIGIGGDAPATGQRVALKESQGDFGITDIDGEEHDGESTGERGEGRGDEQFTG
jgi:hypothetical protein